MLCGRGCMTHAQLLGVLVLLATAAATSRSLRAAAHPKCDWAALHAQFQQQLAAATSYAAVHYKVPRDPPFPSPHLHGTSLVGPAAACVARHALQPAVFIMGDSVDRIVVDAGCARWNVTAHESGAPVNGSAEGVQYAREWEWAWGHLGYKVGTAASNVCAVQRVEVARRAAQAGSHPVNSTDPASVAALFGFVHIFGAEPRGPYLHNHRNTPEDQTVDTVQRVPYATDLFERTLNKTPTVVILRADMWSFYLQMVNLNWNATLAAGMPWHREVDKFVAYTNDTLAWLRARYPPSTLVGVHTVPLLDGQGYIHARYTAGLRTAARRLGLPVWDWAEMMAPRPPAHYLRDALHPSPPHNAAFASWLLSSAKAWEGMRCLCEFGAEGAA